MTRSARARARRSRSGGRAIEIDVRALGPCDVGTIDELARVALDARRTGGTVCLVGAPRALIELVAFSGLAGVLPCAPDPNRAVNPGATADRTSERAARCRERT
jgi:ABC-type transporter Mla MlaB component